MEKLSWQSEALTLVPGQAAGYVILKWWPGLVPLSRWEKNAPILSIHHHPPLRNVWGLKKEMKI